MSSYYSVVAVTTKNASYLSCFVVVIYRKALSFFCFCLRADGTAAVLIVQEFLIHLGCEPVDTE